MRSIQASVSTVPVLLGMLGTTTGARWVGAVILLESVAFLLGAGAEEEGAVEAFRVIDNLCASFARSSSRLMEGVKSNGTTGSWARELVC